MTAIAMRTARDSWLIAGRQLRVLRMNPGRLIYPLVQPLVLLVLFVSVFGNLALTGHGSGSYREFLIPGILLENAALTAPVTGLGLLRDAGSGLADRFRALPMSRAAVIIGRLAADAVVFIMQAALVLAAAMGLLGFRITTGVAGIASTIAVTTLFGVAAAVTSTWLALLIADAETAERVLFFPMIAIVFVSSAFAPVAELAAWMQPIARANPVSSAAELIRSLASGGSAAAPLLYTSLWVAGLAVVPGLLAVRRWQAAS